MADNGLPPGFTLDSEQASAGLPQGYQLDEDKYGSVPQQALTVAEGAARGLLSPPITAAAERGLTALGVPGLSPQEQAGRAETNPWEHGLSEAAGFGVGALAGTGEAAAIGKVGELAGAGAARLGLEGASTVSKIATQGIKTGAEMTALQAADETAKMINEDPGQSLGTAAINIGLSGIIGGAGGAVLGSVSPLWKASMEKMGAPKLIDDAKAQYGFRQSVPNGDVPSAISGELSTRLNEVDNMREQMSNLKGSSLARAMPEVTPTNTAKIDAQIQDISDKMTTSIEKASDNAYLKGAVPKLVQDFQDFLQVVTNPEATYEQKFGAIDDLKRAQQAKARYSLTAEDTALGNFTKNTARDLRMALEDNKVWGEAANVQSKTNAAIKKSIDATEDAVGKFTQKSAVEGGRVVDPAKINTLVNQSLKGKAGLKGDFIGNYVKSTDELADAINKIHTDAGLEAPIRLTPTPALNHTLGRSSPGTTLGNWLYDKGLASVAGHAGAEVAGAGLGSLVGHPALGAIIGERILAPTLTAIAKPLMENATRTESAKAAIDYVGNVIKGDKLLSNATKSFFSSAEVLPKNLLPNVESREKLQESLEAMNDPNHAMSVAGNLGHYLKDHASAAASLAAGAANRLKAMKPVQPQAGPLDKPAPTNKVQQQKYERALDVAQQPLMVLKYAKNGTLQHQDVDLLQSLYPQVHNKIVSQLTQELIKAKTDGKQIPYKERQSLSLLMGTPLDSTLSQASMANIMAANAPKGPPPQPQGQKRVSKSTANSMSKIDKMYETTAQAGAANRTREA